MELRVPLWGVSSVWPQPSPAERPERGGAQLGWSLPQFPHLAWFWGHPMGMTSPFKMFSLPETFFWGGLFWLPPPLGTVPGGKSGMELPQFPPQPPNADLHLQLLSIPQARRTPVLGATKGCKEETPPSWGCTAPSSPQKPPPGCSLDLEDDLGQLHPHRLLPGAMPAPTTKGTFLRAHCPPGTREYPGNLS